MSGQRVHKKTSTLIHCSKIFTIARLFNAVLSKLRLVTIEPVVFLMAFGMGVSGIITLQLYFEKTCKIGSSWYIHGVSVKTKYIQYLTCIGSRFGNGTFFPEDVCDHLDDGEHEREQEYVQERCFHPLALAL